MRQHINRYCGLEIHGALTTSYMMVFKYALVQCEAGSLMQSDVNS